MSYIERKNKYCTFVKKFSFMGNKYRISKYIGKSNITKKEYLIDNIIDISNEEFKLRSKYLEDLNITYNKSLLEKNEIFSININNLSEAKTIKEYILRNFAVEFIFNSNNIEGSNIPAHYVKKLVNQGNISYKNKNEIKEVMNSLKCFEYLNSGFKFNKESIKRVYYLLTTNLVMENGEIYPRGFKKVPIVVNNNHTTAPKYVEKEINSLISWFKTNKNKIHPLILAFKFHLKFELIHPFRNANGRVGRLLLNKILMDSGYFPIIVFKENKKAYFNSIANSGDKEKQYFDFMVKQMNKSYKLFYKIAKQV